MSGCDGDSHSDRHCRHANREHDPSLTTDRTPGPKIGQQRSAKEKKAINQQYLTPQKEKALVAYLLRWAGDGHPLPAKAVRLLALVILRHRTSRFPTLANDDTLEPPGKHWPQYLYAHHPELKARRLKAIDWARANESIYEKVAQWFDMIGKELSNDGILRENVYNMDETGVLLGLRKN
ncbi:hypothetical protein LTR98_011685 [Exophiala xenobiotica]|nr:hypothetical protein LTR98_011685 [Exophiala xenobiotica]